MRSVGSEIRGDDALMAQDARSAARSSAEWRRAARRGGSEERDTAPSSGGRPRPAPPPAAPRASLAHRPRSGRTLQDSTKTPNITLSSEPSFALVSLRLYNSIFSTNTVG
ncbi:unnamed protein product, partial [Iphiclides podalirius]